MQYNKTEASTKLGFVAEVKFPVNSGEIYSDGFKLDNYLFLGGQITHKLGSSDVVGQLFMRGMWRKAFGVKWLAIGNINLGYVISTPIFKMCYYCVITVEVYDYRLSGRMRPISSYFGIQKINKEINRYGSKTM